MTVRIPLNPFTVEMVNPERCIRGRGSELFSKKMPADRCHGCEFEHLSGGDPSEDCCEYEEIELESISGDEEYKDLDGDVDIIYWFQICCTKCNAIIQIHEMGPYHPPNNVMTCKSCKTPHVHLKRITRDRHLFAIPTKRPEYPKVTCKVVTYKIA